MLCPYCNEEIKDGAKKCRFCLEYLDGSKKESKRSKKKTDDDFVEEKRIILEEATLYMMKSVSHYEGGIKGTRIKVAKGLSFSVGGTGGTTRHSQELQRIDSGTLLFTNLNVQFSSDSKSFKIPVANLIDMKPKKDGIVIADGKNNYIFELKSGNGIHFRNEVVKVLAPGSELPEQEEKKEVEEKKSLLKKWRFRVLIYFGCGIFTYIITK